MNLKTIVKVIAVFLLAVTLPVATFAQDDGSAFECAYDPRTARAFGEELFEIGSAREAVEQAAVEVRRARGELEDRRANRTEALEEYGNYLDTISEANQAYARIMGELSSAVRAAGGEVVTTKGETVGFGVEIPPVMRFEGRNFNVKNNRLKRMRDYIEGLVDGLQKVGYDFEFFTEEIPQLEAREKAKLEEFARLRDKLDGQLRKLAVLMRACGVQSEREVEDALIVVEPDLSAPEIDVLPTEVTGGVLDDDPYWNALVDGDLQALLDMMIDDDVDEGGSRNSATGTGTTTIKEPAPDEVPDQPETTNEVSEVNETSEVTGNASASDEDDYGLPGTDGPILPTAGPAGIGGVVLPSPTAASGALAPIVLFPGLAEVGLNDTFSPEALALLETINATGVDLSSLVLDIEACGWDANLICSRFPSLSRSDLSNCVASVEEAGALCTSSVQRKGSGLSVAHCQAACDTRASEAYAGVTLYSLAQNSVRGAALVRLQDQQNLLAERELVVARLVALRNEVNNRQLHIYVHAETGEMTIHDGPYFEPQPPLVYSGYSQRPATTGQVATLVELSAQLDQLERKLVDIGKQLVNSDIWKNAALSHWDAIASRGSSDSCLVVSDVETPLAQCRADCAAQGEPNEAIGYSGPLPGEFCRLSTNMLAAMMDPDAERWLQMFSLN